MNPKELLHIISQGEGLTLEFKNPGIQAKAISIELNIPIDTIDKYIRVLIRKNFIERKGSKKAGGYFIK